MITKTIITTKITKIIPKNVLDSPPAPSSNDLHLRPAKSSRDDSRSKIFPTGIPDQKAFRSPPAPLSTMPTIQTRAATHCPTGSTAKSPYANGVASVPFASLPPYPSPEWRVASQSP